MAERVDVEKSMEDPEKEITCAICHEHYTEPKVLPYCHYYCKQCVHRLTRKAGIDKPFSVADPGGFVETPFGPLFQQRSALCLLSMVRCKQTNSSSLSSIISI